MQSTHTTGTVQIQIQSQNQQDIKGANEFLNHMYEDDDFDDGQSTASESEHEESTTATPATPATDITLNPQATATAPTPTGPSQIFTHAKRDQRQTIAITYVTCDDILLLHYIMSQVTMSFKTSDNRHGRVFVTPTHDEATSTLQIHFDGFTNKDVYEEHTIF